MPLYESVTLTVWVTPVGNVVILVVGLWITVIDPLNEPLRVITLVWDGEALTVWVFELLLLAEFVKVALVLSVWALVFVIVVDELDVFDIAPVLVNVTDAVEVFELLDEPVIEEVIVLLFDGLELRDCSVL